MARKDPFRAELDDLAAALGGGPRNGIADLDVGSAGRSGTSSDLAVMLRDLQHKVSDAAEEVEDIVTAHPLAAVAAAFVLGFLVARVTGRR